MPLNQETRKALEEINLRLLVNRRTGFLGALMLSIKLIDSADRPDIPCQSIWTDGIHIAINQDFFNELSHDEQLFTIMHELVHIARLAPLRKNLLADDRVSNTAFDIIANQECLDEFKKRKIKLSDEFIERMAHDKNLAQLSEEELYECLVEEIDVNAQERPKDQFDNDIQQPGNGDIPSSEVQQQIVQNIIQAAQSAKTRGLDLPNGVEESLEDFLTPKIDWKRLLRRFFDDYMHRSRRTWARPNRRYPDVYRPSKNKQLGSFRKLHIYIDVSGSVSDDEVKEYLTEVKGIHDHIKPKTTVVRFFSDSICDEYEIKRQTDVTKFTYGGRGGTDYTEVIDKIQEENPEVALIFTDLQCTFPNKPKCKTNIIWIKTDEFSTKEPPYGKLIKCSQKEKRTN